MSSQVVAGARFIGERVARKEDGRLLTGRGSYVDDVALPGMLHAAFVRSSIACGTIKSIDTSRARDLPGVWAIYTAEDFAVFDIEMISIFLVVPPPEPRVFPLARGRVLYVGDPIAVVVAETRYIAEDAAGLIEIEYEAETPIVTLDDALTGPPIHAGMTGNVAAALSSPHDPEVERILATAPHLVSRTITHQRVAHSPMEPRGLVVSSHNEELTIYASSQGPHIVARLVTHAFGLSSAGVRVISKDVGGAFGLKAQPWREEMAIVAAGLLLRRPVKWIEDRLENLTAACQAREQSCKIRLGLDESGKLLAAHIDYLSNNGAYPHFADANGLAMLFAWAICKIPHVSHQAQGLFSNTPGLAAYRGPWGMESLARETMLDIAAREIGIEPAEIRRRNLITTADQPTVAAAGLPLEDVTPAECLEELLRHVDITAFRKEQDAARNEGRYLGLGLATYIEPTAGSGGQAFATEAARVRIEPNGKVTAILSTHSQGQGTETTMAQIVADQLGVRLEDVSVLQDDSAAGGFGPGAVGSRQAVAGGGASFKAAQLLADKVKRLAAHLLNANPVDVQIDKGIVKVRGAPAMTQSLADIAAIAYGSPARLPYGMEPGLDVHHRIDLPSSTLSSAAHACIVEVDADTGFVEIKRWICAEDCGVMINPVIVEGQIAGGIAQAIGAVLMEKIPFDDHGNPKSVTFKDYLLPTITDVPEIEYFHLCTPSKTPGGFRGVGEGGAIVGPPTLVNAIADALAPFGALCLDLPLTPSKLLRLMQRVEH